MAMSDYNNLVAQGRIEHYFVTFRNNREQLDGCKCFE